MAESARPERARVAIDDSRRTIWRGDLVRRGCEKHTIDMVKSLRRLFKWYGRPDLPVLQGTVPVISSRVPCERIDRRPQVSHEHDAGQSYGEHHAGGQHEPSGREPALRTHIGGSDTHPIAQPSRKLRRRLQLGGPIECRAQRITEPPAGSDLRAARRTRVEMLKNLAVRFRQQLIAHERIGHVPTVTTVHDDASILLSMLFFHGSTRRVATASSSRAALAAARAHGEGVTSPFRWESTRSRPLPCTRVLPHHTAR